MGCVVSSMEGLWDHRQDAEWLQYQDARWWRSLKKSLPRRDAFLHLYTTVQVSCAVMQCVARHLQWDFPSLVTRLVIQFGTNLRNDYLRAPMSKVALGALGCTPATDDFRCGVCCVIERLRSKFSGPDELFQWLLSFVVPVLSLAGDNIVAVGAVMRHVMPVPLGRDEWTRLCSAYLAVAFVHIRDAFAAAVAAQDCALMTALVGLTTDWVAMRDVCASATPPIHFPHLLRAASTVNATPIDCFTL